MTKLRTIIQCHKHLKELDKDCPITVFCIRKWCKEKVIRSIRVGCKILVDFDSLINYLNKSNLKIA